MQLRTPLARARGLGSAKEGAHHWWNQRISAVALVPLALWFAVMVIDLVGASHQEVTNWLANPINAALMISLIVATFYHAALGLQVVYEDYVEPHGLMIAVNVATKLLCFFLAAASVIAVLKIAIGG